MSNFLWFLSAFWLLIYGIRALRSGLSPKSLLPTTVRYSKASKANVEVNLKNFHLEIRTSAFNDRHDFLIEFLDRRSNQVSRLAAKHFYDLGTIFGVVGVVVGLFALAYTSCQFLASSLAPHHEEPMQNLAKRGADTPAGDAGPGLAISPIIPGVTVPWSHLPLILFALFVSQCFHELGHAIAGSIEGLNLHAVGASLTLILPSAFVSFSSSMESLPTTARLRVISSGAWHNLVLWGLIYLISFTEISSIWCALGWQGVREIGVVVVDLEKASPLTYHLQPGSIISKLDDFVLGNTTTPPEGLWAQYLLKPKVLLEEGWCVDVNHLSSGPIECCNLDAKNLSDHPPAAQLSCFISTESGDQGHCIDPVPILTSSKSPRCFSASDCREQGTPDRNREELRDCVRPDESTLLLRIVVSPPISQVNYKHKQKISGKTVVLWSGPREEVFEQVKVGTLAPRYGVLPVWLPRTTEIFFGYLSTLSLSLYIFNLFALPFLDGSHFLSAILDYIGNPQEPPFCGSIEGEEPDIELGIGSVDTSPPVPRTTFIRGRRSRYNSARGLWTRQWGRLVRQHKTGIERAIRYTIIFLMLTTVARMAWSV